MPMPARNHAVASGAGRQVESFARSWRAVTAHSERQSPVLSTEYLYCYLLCSFAGRSKQYRG